MSIVYMNNYQTIDYLDYQIKRNHNELLKLQIEHLRIQNDILKKLMKQNVCINHSIIKYNIDHQQYQAMIQAPKPPPTNMYT